MSPGAGGAQRDAARQEVAFRTTVEASALCEMEEALRVSFAFLTIEYQSNCFSNLSIVPHVHTHSPIFCLGLFFQSFPRPQWLAKTA